MVKKGCMQTRILSHTQHVMKVCLTIQDEGWSAIVVFLEVDMGILVSKFLGFNWAKCEALGSQCVNIPIPCMQYKCLHEMLMCV